MAKLGSNQATPEGDPGAYQVCHCGVLSVMSDVRQIERNSGVPLEEMKRGRMVYTLAP